MVSVPQKPLTLPRLSGMERRPGALRRSFRPRHAPRRDGGAFRCQQTDEHCP
jgi:hypothetical protein